MVIIVWYWYMKRQIGQLNSMFRPNYICITLIKVTPQISGRKGGLFNKCRHYEVAIWEKRKLDPYISHHI